MATIFTKLARREAGRLLCGLVQGSVMYGWDWLTREQWGAELEAGFTWVPYHELSERHRVELDVITGTTGGRRDE